MFRRKHADLSGDGARLFGGRYTPKGVPAVYTSENVALAVLEVLVHLERSEIPDDYVLLAIEISGREVHSLSMHEAGTVERLAIASQSSAAAFKREFYGDPVLRVPSAVIRWEHNYILLPAATGFDARISWVEPFQFDERLFSKSAEA